MGHRGLVIAAGEVYGKLTILSELPVRARKGGGTERWFRCKCECGSEGDYRLGRLRSGKTRSCGCLVPRPGRRSGWCGVAYLEHPLYHGMEGTPTHSVWRGIRKRCYNPRARGYANYGGRGIVLCSGWKSSFKSFYEDMGERPSLQHSIDRVDGDGNYSCGHCEECLSNGWVSNCRWATRAEQRRNSKNVRMLTFEGETLCLADWAERKGMSKGTLHGRLTKMSVAEALRTPVRQCRTDKQFMAVPEPDRDSEWHRDRARRNLRVE